MSGFTVYQTDNPATITCCLTIITSEDLTPISQLSQKKKKEDDRMNGGRLSQLFPHNMNTKITPSAPKEIADSHERLGPTRLRQGATIDTGQNQWNCLS